MLDVTRSYSRKVLIFSEGYSVLKLYQYQHNQKPAVVCTETHLDVERAKIERWKEVTQVKIMVAAQGLPSDIVEIDAHIESLKSQIKKLKDEAQDLDLHHSHRYQASLKAQQYREVLEAWEKLRTERVNLREIIA